MCAQHMYKKENKNLKRSVHQRSMLKTRNIQSITVAKCN